MQANTEGGGGIHLIHRLSSSDTDDDDDDDDFDDFSLHGNVPSPQSTWTTKNNDNFCYYYYYWNSGLSYLKQG